jgi:hypothetical protein
MNSNLSYSSAGAPAAIIFCSLIVLNNKDRPPFPSREQHMSLENPRKHIKRCTFTQLKDNTNSKTGSGIMRSSVTGSMVYPGRFIEELIGLQ